MMIRRAFSNQLFGRGLARSFSTASPAAATQFNGSSGESSDSSCRLAAAAALLGTTIALTTTTTSVADCEKKKQERPPNPLWPSGISDKDLDAFVDSVLSDSSINMSAIPDAVERAIYKSTVSMTADVIYETFSAIHGTEVLSGYELQLSRRKMGKLQVGDGEYVGIDEAILEQVADRLLANVAINQTMVPDSIERQLYMNCLKLIFHLLDSMAASFCITLCGHDLRLHFEPSSKTKDLTAVSSTTKVDVEELMALARREVDAQGLYGEFQAQLQASLYGLVLGIVDDLLANTEIEILSDVIGIDIVTGATSAATPLTENQKKRIVANNEGQPNVFIPFGLGLGVGAAAMATFFSSRGGN
jgi:hypothetical protein